MQRTLEKYIGEGIQEGGIGQELPEVLIPSSCVRMA